MWTTAKTLNAQIKPRPVRISYLVPSSPSHELLDAIFQECLGRWGGRRTPVIPTDGLSISPEYWALLNLWDADIIYSFIELSGDLEKRLFHLYAPSEIILHPGLGSATDHNNLRPDFRGNFTFLSSLSLVPMFSRQAHIRGEVISQILDDAYYQVESSDLADTFGFVSRSSVGTYLLPHARRLSVKKPNITTTNSYREPSEITYVDDESALIDQINNNWGLLSLGLLADMLCPHLNHLADGRDGWEDHLTIVIGDEIDDRLLFWNAQHRYRSLNTHSYVPVLRISPTRLSNGLPDWLSDWIARRNYRSRNGNSVPRTIVRSCSVSQDDLDSIASDLKGKRMVMVSAEHMATPCIFETLPKYLSKNQTGPYAAFPSHWVFPKRDAEKTVRFKGNEFDVPDTAPWHLQFSSQSTLTTGIWAIDLTIERAANYSGISNRPHAWKFPRRLRTEQGIGFENYHTGGMGLILPPNHRPTESGDLTIWDALGWPRPTLRLPSDSAAFARPLVQFTYASPEDRSAIDAKLPRGHYSHVSISDKGPDLLGVLQLFANLPEALSFLTDPVWLKIINRLSPKAPEDSRGSRKEIARRIKELTLSDQNASEEDYDDIAKRVLQRAGRSIAAHGQKPNFANFEMLFNYVKKNNNSEKFRKRLSENTKYLRNCGFLWQGHGWRCDSCQHYNWVNLAKLEPISNCEICRKPHSAPVSMSLDLRLNPHVAHAFSATSEQESVTWCLRALWERAVHSFFWFPALLLHEHGNSDPITDIDIIAAIDGKLFLVEVKKSFSGLHASEFEKIEKLARTLRPNVAMIAILEKGEQCSDDQHSLVTECRDRLGEIDVNFELLTKDEAGDQSLLGNDASDFGERMKWVGW